MRKDTKVQIDKHIIDKINDGHREIVNSSKDLVQKAIVVGKEIIRAREIAGHGEFGKLIDSGLFDMKKANVYNYIKVAEYSTKVQTIGNLQEAYKLIESEESKRKQAESKEQYERLRYREQYNEKPDNWQRSDDYAWSKLQDERKARDERIAKAKDSMNAQSEQSNTQKEEFDRLRQEAQAGTEMLNDYFSKEQQKIDNLKKMNITNQNGGVLAVLEQYLAGLPSDNQRIEECHNIIKYCKNVSASLQTV